MTTRPAWHESAACDGADLEVFFPRVGARGTADAAVARAICERCPVTTACLTAALDEEIDAHTGLPTSRQIRHGIRGGLTPQERTELARERSTV